MDKINFNDFISEYENESVLEYSNSVSEKKLVSVSVPTYNHEHFIEECLDNILNQKTNFDFEILIGEDKSTDNTRKICKEYADRYPGKIRLFLHHRENNIAIDGRPTARFNSIYNLHKSNGKYIAICEGDDFWIDENKLQKQVDFLEENSDYSICSHSGFSLVNNKRKKIRNYFIHEKGKFLLYRNFIGTFSVMYRNIFSGKSIPEWWILSPMGDRPLNYLVSRIGKIKHLNERMGVRRVHDGGIWSQQSSLTVYKMGLKMLKLIENDVTDEEKRYLVGGRNRLILLCYLFDTDKSQILPKLNFNDKPFRMAIHKLVIVLSKFAPKKYKKYLYPLLNI